MPKHALILLIGSNPLPDFVVAKYLMSDHRADEGTLPVPDFFVLLCSNGTKDFANTLLNQLGIRDKSRLANLGNDEHDRKNIFDKLDDALEPVINQLQTLHLNYTGGRKTMAVHSYFKTAAIASSQLSVRTIFSYLNPDSFKLVLDESGNCFPTESDLRSRVEVSIEDLFELHGMKYESSQPDMTFPQSIINLENFKNDMLKEFSQPKKEIKQRWLCKFDKLKIEQKLIADKFKKKYDTIQVEPLYKMKPDGRTPDPEKKFYGISDYNNDGFFNGIGDDFPSLIKLFPNNQFDTAMKEPVETFKRLIGFFNGTWLEDYILETLKFLKSSGKIAYDKIQKSVRATYEKREIEVDIIVIRGYQMFLISCTTDSGIGRCKLKAFEAIFRSEQLGGDLSQVLFISCLPIDPPPKEPKNENNLRTLEKDIQSFHASQQYRLLGIDHLRDTTKLYKELTAIIGKR